MTDSQAAALGQLLRAARNAKGFSTRQLAEIVGADQSQLVRLEQGKVARPRPGLLLRLGQSLDVRLVDLYELAGIPLPELHPYLRARYGLTDQDTAQVQRYIEKLAAGYGADGSGPLDGADEQPEDH